MLALAVAFYVVSLVFGAAVVNYFFDSRIEELMVKYGFSIPIGFAFASYAVILIEAAAGYFSDYWVGVAVAVMAALSCLLYLKADTRRMFSFALLKKQVGENNRFYGLLALVIVMLCVLQVAGVHTDPRGIVGNGSYATDFLFHISIGNSLIYTGWPPKLLYANSALNVFPFVTDFYTAILAFNGISPLISLYLMNMAMYAAIAIIAVYFISLIIKHRTAAVVGFLMFLFCGVTLNVAILVLLGINPQYPGFQQEFLGSGATNVMQIVTFPLFYFSDPISSNFAPQHDLLLGFPYALIILSVLYLEFFDGKAAHERGGIDKTVLFVGFMAGLMPLLHPFSLVFVFIFAVTAFVYSMLKAGRVARLVHYWVPFGAVALITALPGLLFLRGGSLAQGFWGVVLDMQNWQTLGNSLAAVAAMHVIFWFEAIGPLLVVALVGLYFFRRRWVLFVPAFAVLVIASFMRLSPSWGDMNKLTLYALFFLSVAAANLMYLAWKRGALFKVAVAVIFVTVVIGGVANQYYTVFNQPYPVAANVELQAAAWMVNNTSNSSVFVPSCYDSVFGLTSSLGGRRTLIEFENYIGLVGISGYNAQQVDTQATSFLARPTCAFISQYNISYVVLENVSTLATPWCRPVNYTAFFGSQNFTLYRGFNQSSFTNNILVFRPLCG